MTARPIRYQSRVSDRNGKIFYTSITSLSHISKEESIVVALHPEGVDRNIRYFAGVVVEQGRPPPGGRG